MHGRTMRMAGRLLCRFIFTMGVYAVVGVSGDVDSFNVVLCSEVHCPPRIQLRLGA